MSARTGFIYGALITLAIAFALLTRSDSEATGPAGATVYSTRGGGLAALYAYLKETGGTAAVVDEQPAAATWDTLVIAAPTARPVSRDEVARLEQRVEAGATLVLLTPEDYGSQPALFDWLQLRRTERLPLEALKDSDDRGGATVDVWAAVGPFSGLSKLRVGANRGVASDDEAFMPVAGASDTTVLLWKPHGKGQLIVAAGADLAENRRIELLDNRKLWDNLAARGTVGFDEFHHQRKAPLPVSVGIWAFALQALFAVIFLTLARGTRLGPARPLVFQRHRAGVEYAQSFAWLTRGAHVEKELAADVYQRLRRIIHERLGISLTLPPAEFGRELDRRLNLPEGTWSALDAKFSGAASAASVTPAQFAQLSREAAVVENRVRGS